MTAPSFDRFRELLLQNTLDPADEAVSSPRVVESFLEVDA